MQPTMSLQQRQSQSLVMTQALQQSIKLLQMNALELHAFVDTQLENNPFLAENDAAPEGGESEAQQAREAEETSQASVVSQEEADFMPEEWQDSVSVDAGMGMRYEVSARNSDGDLADFSDTRERDITLKEHLWEQLAVEQADPLTKRIGQYLVDLVDEAGYIKEELANVALQLGTETSHVEEALALLQGLDPAGVCARNLQECLSLQLRELDRLDPAMEALLANLPLLAEGNLEALKKRCEVDAEDLRQMIGEIRALNPKPGLSFSREIVEVVEPDVTVKRDTKGNWHVELNSSALPKVLVNRRYFAKVAEHSKGGDKKYMTERMAEANWLIKALDQRAHTILKVSTEIVAQQDAFFRMGIHHLKPLTLKDIARETGFHESTVSRVTTGKYLITPRGIFELKYFFTSGVSHGAGGDDVSSQTVKFVIKEMIEAESPGNVLSDDDLAEKLKARNINVARRTVAKYREALGIPSSMQRKRMKKVAG